MQCFRVVIVPPGWLNICGLYFDIMKALEFHYHEKSSTHSTSSSSIEYHAVLCSFDLYRKVSFSAHLFARFIVRHIVAMCACYVRCIQSRHACANGARTQSCRSIILLVLVFFSVDLDTFVLLLRPELGHTHACGSVQRKPINLWRRSQWLAKQFV